MDLLYIILFTASTWDLSERLHKSLQNIIRADNRVNMQHLLLYIEVRWLSKGLVSDSYKMFGSLISWLTKIHHCAATSSQETMDEIICFTDLFNFWLCHNNKFEIFLWNFHLGVAVVLHVRTLFVKSMKEHC